jgi:hypothetical protein
VIWNNDASDDFLAFYGIYMSDIFWKIIVHCNHDVACIVPILPDAKCSCLDYYLVSIDAVEEISGLCFVLPMNQNVVGPLVSWKISVSYDKW